MKKAVYDNKDNTPGVKAEGESAGQSSNDESVKKESDGKKKNRKKTRSQVSDSLKDIYSSVLSQYENGKTSLDKLRSAVSKHFSEADLNERQEMVINLYSSDPAIKSITARNFAMIDEHNVELTPFDMAAREKSRILARSNLKNDDFLRESTVEWLLTLGRLGNKKDINLLLETFRRFTEINPKNLTELQGVALEAISSILDRNPHAIREIESKDLAYVIVQGLDSKNRKIREMLLTLLLESTRNKRFTNNFLLLLSGLPRTDRIAQALGDFSIHLMSDNPDVAAFALSVIERSLKGADDQFIINYLREATGNLLSNLPAENTPSVDYAADSLGKYYETFLYTRREKNNFKKKTPVEKIKEMINFFHPGGIK